MASPNSTAFSLSAALMADNLRLREYARLSNPSPYYRGLTDSGLYLRSLGLSSDGADKAAEYYDFSDFNASTAHPLPQSPPDPVSPASLFTSVFGCFFKRGRERTLRGREKIIVAHQWRPLRENMMKAEEDVKAVEVAVEEEEDLEEDGRRSSVGELFSDGEEKYVWARKYRPKSLKEFICNKDKAEELQQLLMTNTECTNFIFEGPPGVGKTTMVLALLRDAFGPAKLKMKNEVKRIELKGELATSVEVNVRKSSQHVEVNLSEFHGYEKHVIVALINESIVPMNKGRCDHTNCRVIVLHEADRLSTDAQHYVRWMMEKHEGGNRIFFCCSDASKLQPLGHLCKIIHLKTPSQKEIVDVLEFIAEKENIELPRLLAKRIAENSKNNLRQAIRSFEASWKLNDSFEDNPVIVTGWEDDIADIAKNIVDEQSPKQLYIIRGKLKNLIEHDVSPDFIFITLVAELKKNLDENFKAELDKLYLKYSGNAALLDLNKSPAFPYEDQESRYNNLQVRKKNIRYFMIIEEFTAKFMSYYKFYITKKVEAERNTV